MPIGTRLGDCNVVGVLRQGAYGVAYEGVERSSSRNVAIKEYLPLALADRAADGQVVVRSLRHQPAFREGMQAFLSEARTLAAIDEPALVKVLDVWEQHGTAYMTTPLHEGRMLKDALRDSERPTEAWLKRMLSPLLDALATLHARKCYPCDATPDNIVLLADESPMLFDFGLTRRIIANATEDVTVVLKPGFAPIEQCVQDPSMPEGPWTDVYAVAAGIYLAITGKAPTAPTTRIVADTMQPLRDVTKEYSERFLAGVDRALAVRPEHRPQTIAEFRTALGIPTGVPDAIPPSPPIASPPPAEADPLEATQPMQRAPLEPAHDRTRVRVLGDGKRITPPFPQFPAQPPPHPPSQAAAVEPARSAPWKLVVSLVVVVALAAIGILVWMQGEPPNAPPRVAGTADPASNATRPAPETAKTPSPGAPASVAPGAETSTVDAARSPEPRPSPQVPESPRLQQADAAAGLPTVQASPGSQPPATGAALSGPAAPGGAPATSVPTGTAPAVASARPAQGSGKIQFSIKPWGEILIDGKPRGVSPPIKELAIPEGRHRIEIRNGAFPGYASDIVVKAGSDVAITHTFKAP